jgi:very-short-patch-repair endonuclease
LDLSYNKSMKLYKFIPYNKNLISRARELRKSETETEKIFWSEILKNKKLINFKFTRQKPIGNFIVDFYCAKLKLAIEIDGEIHKFQKIRDDERDNLLKQKFGVKIIRYKNKDVLNNTEVVLNDLIHKLTFPPDKGD